MIDQTNLVAVVQAAPAAVQSTFNAWHIVALGVGAAVVHAYHVVCDAGGVKRIWSNFWNGRPPAMSLQPGMPASPSGGAK